MHLRKYSGAILVSSLVSLLILRFVQNAEVAYFKINRRLLGSVVSKL